MKWFIIIAVVVVVLVVLATAGVFRKEDQCRHCSKMLKGIDQNIWGNGEDEFILCADCADKIPHMIAKYTHETWSYKDFQNYLIWDKDMIKDRAAFNPTEEYGRKTKLRIDSDNGLFSLSDNKSEVVMRFKDVFDSTLNFRPKSVKEGMLGRKATGEEYAEIIVLTPAVHFNEVLCNDVTYRLKSNGGIIHHKYVYELSEKFSAIIQSFTISKYLAGRLGSGYNAESGQQDIGKIQKALALFMFDSMEEVNETTLKQQRNALIKAFHPDNHENSEAYASKINEAYELLHDLITH